jgi:hypothetical protein
MLCSVDRDEPAHGGDGDLFTFLLRELLVHFIWLFIVLTVDIALLRHQSVGREAPFTEREMHFLFQERRCLDRV